MASVAGMRPTSLLPALALVLPLALSGCGQMQAETNENSAEDRAPACEDVWTEGTVLPTDYTGCEQGGSLQPSDLTECQDGTRLATFDGLFGLLGESVRAGGPDSAAYTSAVEQCTGA